MLKCGKIMHPCEKTICSLVESMGGNYTHEMGLLLAVDQEESIEFYTDIIRGNTDI